MHICPHCGMTLTAPPSHCHEQKKVSPSSGKAGVSSLLILALGVVTIATLGVFGLLVI